MRLRQLRRLVRCRDEHNGRWRDATRDRYEHTGCEVVSGAVVELKTCELCGRMFTRAVPAVGMKGMRDCRTCRSDAAKAAERRAAE